MGRPSKLTPEVQKRITDAIRVGATYELACHYAGISYQTFLNWRERKGSQYVELFEAINRAEGDAAIKWLAVIDKASIEQWQAAAWKLERRYPHAYGRSVTEVTGKDSAPLMIKLEWGDRGIEAAATDD